MILILHRRSAGGIKIIDADHVEFNVKDVEASARFYKMILGFEEVFIFTHWAVLQAEKSVLSLLKSDVIYPAVIQFRTNSKEVVADTLKRLIATGSNILSEPSYDVTEHYTISFADPTGNAVSLSFIDHFGKH